MRYVRAARSPLKRGVDVTLGPKTLLLGRNGAGKTAVMQTIKLALTGSADDHEGRDGVKDTVALSRLFKRGVDLTAEVELNDGAVCTWAVKAKKVGFSRPEMTGTVNSRFPFQDLKQLMSQDERKLKVWLESKAGTTLDDATLLSLLPTVQQAEAKKVLQEFSERSPVELSAVLKRAATTSRTGATRKEKVIESMVQGLPLPLDQNERGQLTLRSQELNSKLQLGSAMTSEQHAQLRQSILSKVEVLTSLQEQLAGMQESTAEDGAKAAAARIGMQLTSLHIEHFGSEVCHVCLRDAADIRAAKQRWQNLGQRVSASLSREKLVAQIADLEVAINDMADKYKTVSVVDVAALLEERKAVDGQLVVDTNNRNIWRQAEALRQEIRSDRALADIWVGLARTWEEEGASLLNRRKVQFESQVSAWLPLGELFFVDPASGRIGLAYTLDAGSIWTALSGAETVKVLLAILASEADDSTLTILEHADISWHPDTLASVMGALTEAPAQVILMSTVPPTYVPEGWLVVNLDE